MPRRALALLVGLLLGACGSGASDSNRADTTYGAPIDATDAMPVPAVAAEDSLYRGQRVTIDGRIAAIRASGCAVRLATDAAPLVVTAHRTDGGDCAWQGPGDAQGFVVAAGTLRVAADTLRLTANGVRVTPVRILEPDS